MSTTRQRGGRIHPHQRDTNDAAPILGENISSNGNFQEQYYEIHSVGMSDKNRKDYRARIVRTVQIPFTCAANNNGSKDGGTNKTTALR